MSCWSLCFFLFARSHCDFNPCLKEKYPWKNDLAINHYINEAHWLPKGNKKKMFQWYLRVWSYIRLFITYSFIHCWGFQRWLYSHWGAAGAGKAMNTLLPHSQPYKENHTIWTQPCQHAFWEQTAKPTGMDPSCTVTQEESILGKSTVSVVYIRLLSLSPRDLLLVQ